MKQLTLPILISLALGTSVAIAQPGPAPVPPAGAHPAAAPAYPVPPAPPAMPKMPEMPAAPKMPAYPNAPAMPEPPKAPDFEAAMKEREKFMTEMRAQWEKTQKANEEERKKMIEEQNQAIQAHMEKMRSLGMPGRGRGMMQPPARPAWAGPQGGPPMNGQGPMGPRGGMMKGQGPRSGMMNGQAPNMGPGPVFPRGGMGQGCGKAKHAHHQAMEERLDKIEKMLAEALKK